MFIDETNADVARIALSAGGIGVRGEAVLDFRGGPSRAVWTGRIVPSRHNTRAPDIVFDRFRSRPQPDTEAGALPAEPLPLP
jgi:hypothetical protein